jgi:ATP:ADP antiporter, AAA family
MNVAPSAAEHERSSILQIFGDVREDETVTTFLLLANVFVMLAGYYVCKTVREPLILNGGGAAVKSYAAAGQALVLMAFVPAYGWFASRVDRLRLLTGVSAFFIINLQLFWLAGRAGLPYVGVAFFIWVGIFNNAVVSQFWSYGNDLFDKATGERLFPVIGIGATLGSPIGAKFAETLFKRGANPFNLLQVAAACLAISMLLYWLVDRREEGRRQRASTPIGQGQNGFALLLESPYLGMICLLLLVLNLVNTTGEYILSSYVVERANALKAADPSLNTGAFIGAFYGNYFFWVNILAIVLQSLVASRLVKYLGMGGALFALPFVALGAYGMLAAGAGMAIARVAKTAENATDYSIMNVARQMLWLPTTREEKYKAKQAADTFVVRSGDVLAAAVVWVGTTWLGVGAQAFAFSNVVLVCVWIGLSFVLLREYRRRSAATTA